MYQAPWEGRKTERSVSPSPSKSATGLCPVGGTAGATAIESGCVSLCVALSVTLADEGRGAGGGRGAGDCAGRGIERQPGRERARVERPCVGRCATTRLQRRRIGLAHRSVREARRRDRGHRGRRRTEGAAHGPLVREERLVERDLPADDAVPTLDARRRRAALVPRRIPGGLEARVQVLEPNVAVLLDDRLERDRAAGREC